MKVLSGMSMGKEINLPYLIKSQQCVGVEEWVEGDVIATHV